MNALVTAPLETVTLRPATARDCESVWRWNFAPEVRARSKQTATVAFGEHARWFRRRLTSGTEPIWVIEEYFLPVGVVRLDAVARGFTRISIALARAARGRGIGKAAITAACRTWRAPICAEVYADNLASRTCFEACGFHSVVECDGLLTYHWDPEI